jgi:hypothetical protein
LLRCQKTVTYVNVLLKEHKLSYWQLVKPCLLEVKQFVSSQAE